MNLAEVMRPKTLDDVIGNEHVVSALKKQLETNTLSQTLMFTGDAGQGKTTFAKIIANELKAEVSEIDCGSEGSIETIRDLVDSSKLTSLFANKKVFILDEVHALSKPGQSALLKTLEEPQKNVHFILLTTDPNKVLNTIRTRCVEYETKPATTEQIGEAVKKVEVKFGVTFENRKDLWSIVEQANGSLRQVYAFLEKLVAVADNNNVITSAAFHDILGSSMEQVDENLPKAFLSNDLVKALTTLNNLRKGGMNPTGTLIGIYNYLKLVYLKNPEEINDKNKELMYHTAFLISEKTITWDSIESLAWKYL